MFKINKVIFRLTVLLFIVHSIANAQFIKEKIYFESANPFSLSDIIKDLDKQEKQKVKLHSNKFPLKSNYCLQFWLTASQSI